MKRRLFNILSAMSLVLCALVVGLWITSSTHPRSLVYRKGLVIWSIASERAGGVMAGYVTTSAADERPDGWRIDSVELPIDAKAIVIPKLQWQALGSP